jgi:microcystin-dependent protein
MASVLCPISLTPMFDNNGSLVRTAKLYFYKPNTLDPVTVYKDEELSTPHTQPVTTGGSGRIPIIYVGEQDYRIRIFDAYDALVEDIPFLPAAVEGSGGGGGGGGSETAIETGDVIWSFRNGIRAGWVRLNGGTIGPTAASVGSIHAERHNNDTEALFKFLWGQDSTGLLLAVEPSRGASAQADWDANKRIRLPDARGRVLAGLREMGNVGGQDNLQGVTWSLGSNNVLGSLIGVPTIALTVAQMPVHSHTATQGSHTHTASQGAHTHTLTDPGHSHGASQPAHNHGVTDPTHTHTYFDPGHQHDYARWSAGSGSATNSGGSLGNLTQGSGFAAINIGINNAATGISIQNAQPSVTVSGAFTGMLIGNAQPAITVGSAQPLISVGDSGSGQQHVNVQPTMIGTYYMRL